jgi:hypothetical protein
VSEVTFRQCGFCKEPIKKNTDYDCICSGCKAKLRVKLIGIQAKVYSLEGKGTKDDYVFVESLLNEIRDALSLLGAGRK